MASYTDGNQAIIAPSSPQVDLNLYSNVLQYKQNQYDTGVQRVQGAIDSVAGLEVYRPQDKQYLQNKLGDMTSQIQSMAGADFSNSSIVAQASSLAPKIARDSVVQNALIGTQGVKSLMASQKEMEDKHPERYSASAKFNDDSAVQSYLSNPNVGASYNGPTTATPYYDYNEPLQKLLKEKAPTVSVTMKPGGGFTYIQDTTSKVTQEDLSNLIDGFFNANPNYQQSIKMDGNYAYKDYDNQGLSDKVMSTLGTQKSSYEKQLVDLQAQYDKVTNDINARQDITNQAISTHNLLTGVKSALSDYGTMFKNGTSLSAIKERLQMDQVRGLYINEYQKSNEQIEQKTNDEAINNMKFQMEQEHLKIDQSKQSLDFIKSGIDPVSGKALQEGDALYPQYLNANRDPSKTTGNLVQKVTVTPFNAADGITGVYDMNTNTSNIKLINDKLTSTEEQAKMMYAQKQQDGVYGSKNTENSFKDWKAKNEDLLQNPDKQYTTNPDGSKKLDHPVDPDYLAYRSNTTLDKMEASTLVDLQNTLSRDATNKIPLPSSKAFSIDGLNYNRNGNTHNSLFIDPGKSPEFISAFNILNTAVKAIQDKENNIYNQQQSQVASESLGGPGGTPFIGGTSDTDAAKQALSSIDQYKGTPVYDQMKAIIDSGKWSTLSSKLGVIIGNTLDQRNQYVNDELNKRASRINPQGTPIDEKDKSNMRQLVISALDQNPTGAPSIKNPDKIDPITKYTGKDGNAYIQYNDEKGNPQEVKVPSLNNTIANPDPDQRLRFIINESYNGITPTKGPSILASDDGRIKYAIGKNFNIPGKYVLYLIDGNNRPRANNISYNSPSEAMSHINELSSLKDPNTNEKYSTQQIAEMAKRNNY